MVEIRNLKFQPLALHLANSKRSVHLPPRGRTEIDERDVSHEMRRAAERGFIVLSEAKAPKPAADVAKPKLAARPQAPAVADTRERS